MTGAPDEARVRRLLGEQHRDLAHLELTHAAGGGDHWLWRLGADLAVRLPATADAADQGATELMWLPGIASRMPVPIPVPVRAGRPSATFPRCWMITTWVPGNPADVAPLATAVAADRLADALKALHGVAPPSAPATQRPTLERLSQPFEQKLDSVGEAEAVTLRRVWRTALAADVWSGTPVWIHGDLHPANVLTDDGDLAGMIDFGLLSAGDPAIDLGAAWALLPVADVPRFLELYQPSDESTILRAGGWAAYIGLSLIGMGQPQHRGEPWYRSTFRGVGERTVRALVDHSAAWS